MHRLYPNRYGRATRLAARLRVVLALLALTIAVSLAPLGSASAATSLREPDKPNYEAYGWTFLGLSVVSLAVGFNALSQRNENLDKAEASFKKYKVATDPSTVAQLRRETSRTHNAAKAWESTANVGLLLGVVFAATSYGSFTIDPNEPSFMSLTHRSVSILIRF